MTLPERIPVIAGIGEIRDDPVDVRDALEPIALMEAALRCAVADAGGRLLRDIDSIDVVNQISWPYADPARALCSRLGLQPVRVAYGPVGGETPIRFLHEAAARIWRGESRVAAICGGEAHRSVATAKANNILLPWTTPSADPARSIRGQDRARELARRLDVHIPAAVYPFFENAQAHYWGQTPEAALAESGELWAAMSQTAACNPFAWLKRPLSCGDIIDVTPLNRLIADPYRKLMIANIAVNQGAAIIVTSLACAREAGIDDSRLIFIRRGFAANEPEDPYARDSYAACPARDAVLEACMASVDRKPFDAVELYSCFPCVPKAARRTLELPDSMASTVTGGLTFFGAPLNNYMSHATAAATRRLRDRPGRMLLYAQGGFATKHHALILASAPSQQPDAVARDPNVQDDADRRRGPVPPFLAKVTGPATVESHTVVHGRTGKRHGVVIVRTASGDRSLARIPQHDVTTLSLLENRERFAIGVTGTISTASDGLPEWIAA